MSKTSKTEKNNQTVFHKLHHYQKSKVEILMRWLTISCIVLWLIALGLGALWYYSSSWAALVFAVIFAAMGIALSGVTFILAEKVELINTLASGALSVYDATQKTNVIIDVEEDEGSQELITNSTTTYPPESEQKE